MKKNQRTLLKRSIMIKKGFLFFGLLVLFCLMLSCKKESPTSPTPPPTAQSITVTSSSDLLHIGISETFTATATMSDGSSRAVTGGVWGGDNPNVATVEAATGQVTIVGSGMVSIFVDYQGKRGSKVIRGIPNYQGAWTGSYRIVSCTCTGDFRAIDFCSLFPVNMVFPTNLNLIQDGDSVQGSFHLGTLVADTSGPIQTNGQLLLTGFVREPPITMDVSWRMQSKNPGQITGSLTQLWRMTGLSGDARIKANIRNLNRTSTMATTLVPSTSRMLNPTLKDLFRALIRR